MLAGIEDGIAALPQQPLLAIALSVIVAIGLVLLVDVLIRTFGRARTG